MASLKNPESEFDASKVANVSVETERTDQFVTHPAPAKVGRESKRYRFEAAEFQLNCASNSGPNVKVNLGGCEAGSNGLVPAAASCKFVNASPSGSSCNGRFP